MLQNQEAKIVNIRVKLDITNQTLPFNQDVTLLMSPNFITLKFSSWPRPLKNYRNCKMHSHFKKYIIFSSCSAHTSLFNWLWPADFTFITIIVILGPNMAWNLQKKSFHMQLKLAKQFRHGKHLCATSTNSRQIPKRFQSWNHILQNHRQIIEKSPHHLRKLAGSYPAHFQELAKFVKVHLSNGEWTARLYQI